MMYDRMDFYGIFTRIYFSLLFQKIGCGLQLFNEVFHLAIKIDVTRLAQRGTFRWYCFNSTRYFA